VHLRLNPARWLRAHAVTLAALVLICAHAVIVAALLGHSYFRQDDFLILDHAAATPKPGWNYLMGLGGARNGHLMPAGLAIAWALARSSSYNWPLASVVISVLVTTGWLAVGHTP